MKNLFSLSYERDQPDVEFKIRNQDLFKSEQNTDTQQIINTNSTFITLLFFMSTITKTQNIALQVR